MRGKTITCSLRAFFLWWMKEWWWIRCLEIVITVEYEPENETIAIHCTSTLSLNTYITWRNNSDSNSTHRFETIQTVLITFWTKFFVCLILHLAQPNSFLYSHAAITVQYGFMLYFSTELMDSSKTTEALLWTDILMELHSMRGGLKIKFVTEFS